MPIYIRLFDGTIEPRLVTDDERGKNPPIGGTLVGFGCLVTESVLISRRVAASWYAGERLPLPDVLFTIGASGNPENPRKMESHAGNLDRWIPVKSALI
jgi:hypothetical protein